MNWLLPLGIALFFAMNIGASGTAASMGSAYGAGAVNKRVALALVAAGTLTGAGLGGGKVVQTISGGLIPATEVTPGLAVIILATASVTLFVANLRGIPLSTSEVTVGALVGVGLARGVLLADRLPVILIAWAALPFLAFTIAALLGRLLRGTRGWNPKTADRRPGSSRFLAAGLVAAGTYEAVAAGMNNVANAVGPLVGAGLLALPTAQWLGGAFVGLGALALGGRVLETNGKKITELTLLGGTVVSGTTGSLVILASWLGLPVPLTQATTAAIMGVAFSRSGVGALRSKIILNIIEVWVLSPLLSLVGAYFLTTLAGSTPPTASAPAMSFLAVILFAYLAGRGFRGFALPPRAGSPDR